MLNHISRRNSGSVYVAVLGVSLIVAVISIAAMHVARIEMREVTAVNEISRARLMAESGIEFAISRIKANPLWRLDYVSGVTNTLSGALSSLTGSGQFDFTLTDNDGDLNDDNQDSITLRSVGTAGGATSVVEVLLQPTGAGLNSLAASLHSAGPISIQDTLTTDQMVSANSNITIAGGKSIQGNAWATGTINGSVTGTANQNQSPPREMPDPVSVFEYYLANGTSIPFTAIPGGKITKVVISAGHNPYIPNATNAQGIYVIDCQGNDLQIENARIEATLVIVNLAAKLQICKSIHWQPAIANFPALMTQGLVEMKWDRNKPLSEQNLGINFNPAHTPDNGIADNDTDDSYPSIISGLVYIDGNLAVTQHSRLTGVVVVTGTVLVDKPIILNYQSTFLDRAPPGFAAGADMQIVPGTWKQVAY